MTTKFVTHDSYELAYTYAPVSGQPTILFLPGYYSDMSGTKSLFLKEQAAKYGYGFLSLDYSGHGQSGGDFLEGTISSWLEDVIVVIEAVQAKDLIVVGSSMGGWLMLLLALKRPQLIRKLVGIAVAPDFIEKLVWPKLSEPKKKHLVEQGWLVMPSAYSASGTLLSYKFVKNGRENLLLDKPIECEVPVRLIHGTADRDVPYEFSLRVMDLLTASDVHVRLIKDGDHRLSNPEALKILWEEVAR